MRKQNLPSPSFMKGGLGRLEGYFPAARAFGLRLYSFWINLGISNSQGTLVWQSPQPAIFTPYSAFLDGPMILWAYSEHLSLLWPLEVMAPAGQRTAQTFQVLL